MPLTYLVSTLFLRSRFHCVWHLFEQEVHIFCLRVECTNCLVIWESDTYSYYNDTQMCCVPLRNVIVCLI